MAPQLTRRPISKLTVLIVALALSSLVAAVMTLRPAHANSTPFISAYGGPGEIWVSGNGFTPGATVRVEAVTNPGLKAVGSPQNTQADSYGDIGVDLRPTPSSKGTRTRERSHDVDSGRHRSSCGREPPAGGRLYPRRIEEASWHHTAEHWRPPPARSGSGGCGRTSAPGRHGTRTWRRSASTAPSPPAPPARRRRRPAARTPSP